MHASKPQACVPSLPACLNAHLCGGVHRYERIAIDCGVLIVIWNELQHIKVQPSSNSRMGLMAEGRLPPPPPSLRQKRSSLATMQHVCWLLWDPGGQMM
jgi:hypothetical protein